MRLPRLAALGLLAACLAIGCSYAEIRDAKRTVAALLPTGAGTSVGAKDLAAFRNSKGEGVLAVCATAAACRDNSLWWLVLDGVAYALTPETRALTPGAARPSDHPAAWARTGLDLVHPLDTLFPPK